MEPSPLEGRTSFALSDKEILLLKKTYRNVTEQYYENPSEPNAELIIALNTLLCQTISQKKDSDKLAILSVLQILKVKSKSHPKLSDSVQKIVQHMKNPTEKPLQFSTIVQCFKQGELFGIGCTFAYGFYPKVLRSQGVDWKQIISEIGKRPSLNTDMCLELLNIICKDNEGNAKHVVKSGFVKYIISFYLQQKLQDKYLLYKALKFLKLISNADRTVLRDRQKALAKVIYTYDEYIPVLQELCGKCYDDEYCGELYKKNKYELPELDYLYVWSFNQSFVKGLPAKNITDISKAVERPDLNPEAQAKLYAILNNIVKFTKTNIPQLIEKTPKSLQTLNNFLKFLSSSIENEPQSYNKANFAKLEKLVAEDPNSKSSNMFKYLQLLKPDKNTNKINKINSKLLQAFCIDKNADILMQGAGRVPKNNQDMKVIKQILKKKQAINEFEADLLNSVKDKALDSLSTALIDRKKLELNSLLNEVDLTNITILSKLLKLVEICLMMGHYQVDDFDKNRIFQIIEWIQNNYHGELIDWGSISQIVMIFEGEDAWMNHLSELPNRCFWLLGCIQVGEENIDALFKKLGSIYKAIDKKSYKISMIAGFVGRFLTRQQKISFIQKLPDFFKSIQADVKSEHNWKTNLYMSALFLSKWHNKTDQKGNKVFQNIIQSVHTHVMNNFKSSEHEYKYLETCLPYKIRVQKIVDNIDFLLSEYGDLANYVYQNSATKPNINYDKIANLSNTPHSASQSILELLKFLKENDTIVQGQEITKLLKKITQNQQKYWELYPNFVTIINSILQIIGKTDNPVLNKNITEILVDIIGHMDGNQEITPEQADQILQEIVKTLKALAQKGTPIDIERLRRASNKIKNYQIQNNMKQVLENYKIIQKTPEPPKPAKVPRNMKPDIALSKPSQVPSSKTQQVVGSSQKIGSEKQIEIPKHIEKKQIKPKQVIIEKVAADRNYMTTFTGIEEKEIAEVQEKGNHKEKEHLWVDQKQTNKVADEIDLLETQTDNQEISTTEMTVIQALKKIKKMVDKKITTQEFPQCAEIFQKNQLKPNQKDILGHLLAQLYHIDPKEEIIDFLLDKKKTNLSKEACYDLVSKHAYAFILSERWKFIGPEWVDIAVPRLAQGFFWAACQVIEYNLVEIEDLELFYDDKFYLEVTKNINRVDDDEDATFYLLLIGTSARLPQIKRHYIDQKLHLTILNYIERWPENHRITSNTFYALSSLVYSQPQICLEIVKKQSQMRKLLESMRKNYDSKAVIESGGCFIANMAYSNDDVKEILRRYEIIQKLVFVFEKSLEDDPEISTCKQLLRALGNLSLSQKCAKQIIDSEFCKYEVKMIEVFNMFINLDENKLKLLKIAIDVFANLCSHKYNLPLMHKNGVTSTMIMLLETTELNSPIIMGCIDTVDGLCQNPQIEAHSVNEKKLPYILIDVLKIQQDEKIIVKATRLLTNLTITPGNIQKILEANLLSVLANIVMPSFFMKYNEKTQLNYLSNNPTVSTPPNKKMEMYINKILVRIHNSKPVLSLVLKSGYLDCLVRTIETADNLQDTYIEILGSYAKGLPNFLNKRAFMCLIRVLTRKIKSKQTIEKCLKIFKTLLLRSYDRDQEDVVLADSLMMYEVILQNYKVDTLYLLGLHCSISKKFRKLLISEQKKYNIIPAIQQMTENQELEQLANTVLFTLFNKEEKQPKPQEQQNQERALKSLSEGFMCELYRIDGTRKKAKIQINEQKIVAYKYPDGEIKKKYTIPLKTLRDWQFNYQKGDRQWKMSVFNKDRGMFSGEVPAENCATMIGGMTWGEIAYINVEFNSKEDKEKFNKCLSALIVALN